MHRLSESIINDLVVKFMAANTDEKYQTVIDQLGMHPVNHALFAHRLARLDLYHEWAVYKDLTRSLGG